MHPTFSVSNKNMCKYIHFSPDPNNIIFVIFICKIEYNKMNILLQCKYVSLLLADYTDS